MSKKDYNEDSKTKNKNDLSKDTDEELLNKEFEKQIIQDRYHRKYLGIESSSRYKDELIKKAIKKEKDKDKP
ncbi:MAG: hypothetical protein EF806_01995 [Candidatus Methanoliparum thermophilum]|uniref:Uncharacterized protein n=1 Tax=Methanoliparum thermophilum TaxID=2491083 RepID=A0A520KSI0_METT2|nr:hypothetical protein [Candidatus Methanoliparum sp. LAM-1]RZN64844.1 MAG: hypothetical protein EF806_01995 [Candidatus Methanoliparum thermophilum]BDC36284.1 hypothetical protein MTLP_09660 [Candidatus Methanoliparum sp. LAM-1]